MKTFKIAMIVCALCLVACGDKSSKGKSNSVSNGDGSNDNLKTVSGPVDEGEAKSVITDRICDAYQTCGCGEIAGVDLTNCRAGLGFSYDAFGDQVRELNLTYDGDCVERLINAMAERGCETEVQYNPYCRPEQCQVYYGTKQVGEECEGGLSYSECAQGLVCLGECQEPCQNGMINIPEGGVCYDEERGIRGACDVDLLCDTTGDGTCKTLPTVGEPCLQNALCAEGLYCNAFEGEPIVCEPVLAEGAECIYPVSCESTNCSDGTCGPAPGEGEPCTQKCASDDLVCAFDGGSQVICMSLPTAGEPCLQNSATPCGEGLTCDGANCVEKPALGESCGDAERSIYLQCEEGAVCTTILCRLKPDEPGCAACAGDDSCTALVCQKIPPSVCGDSGYLLY